MLNIYCWKHFLVTIWKQSLFMKIQYPYNLVGNKEKCRDRLRLDTTFVVIYFLAILLLLKDS